MKILTLILVLLMGSIGYAQSSSVQGSVIDGALGKEPLAFANVKVQGLDISTETSLEGTFKLNLLEGNYTLVIEFIGYEPVKIEGVVVSGSNQVLKPVVINTLSRSTDLVSASEGK